MFKILASVLLGMSTSVFLNQASADELIQSGLYRTPLVELYTSQECPNCEEAEEWVDSLRNANNGSSKPLALAFHVNYLDSSAHQDPYASKEVRGTARQKQLVKLNQEFNQNSFMYTPQVFTSSREVKDWKNKARVQAVLDLIANEMAKSTISLSIAQQGQTLDVHGVIRAMPASLVYLAVYENGLKDRVNPINKQNTNIEHQRVVRQLIGPFPVPRSGLLDKGFLIDLGSSVRNNSGIVLFVELANGEVDQALDFPLQMAKLISNIEQNYLNK